MARAKPQHGYEHPEWLPSFSFSTSQRDSLIKMVMRKKNITDESIISILCDRDKGRVIPGFSNLKTTDLKFFERLEYICRSYLYNRQFCEANCKSLVSIREPNGIESFERPWGRWTAEPGTDLVIKLESEDGYPIKKDIFERTYDRAAPGRYRRKKDPRTQKQNSDQSFRSKRNI